MSPPNDGPFTIKHHDSAGTKVDSYASGQQPLPFRNGKGANILGPRNYDRERQNSDIVKPPSTDHGSMPNMKWSFANSHKRMEVRLVYELKTSVNVCIGRRVGTTGDRTRITYKHRTRRSEHASRGRRDPRASLA